jgi:subtilisin family serine protease
MQQCSSKDTVVAVIDTGVTPDQLDQDRILPGINFSDEGGTYDTSDHHGHGTALAKTILGIAPQCRLLPIKLMTRRGSLRDLKRIDSVFDWIIDHRAEFGINIICTAFANFSHATSDELHRGTHLQQQIAELREMNVATIAPAGNWYREHRQQNSQGMAWPAILREVVSVGALQRQPDGLWLTKSTQRLHADLNTGCRTTVFTEPGELGETSGAAAVVTGCLAVLHQLCPNHTVDTLVQMLLHYQSMAYDQAGLTWPAIDVGAIELSGGVSLKALAIPLPNPAVVNIQPNAITRG